MKILVAIANYGIKNDGFLKRLLEEYAAMPWEVHVVVLTNVAKYFGPGVEVVVEIPEGDPWSFPFAHKRILADRRDEFDLFIYSEDDTLIARKNVEAFLAATEVLGDAEVAGFIRSERGPDGKEYFSTAHGPFHWDPRSVVSRGAHTFASFTNHHSACYILTRTQLHKAIKSGGFLVPAHQNRYDLLVTVATDPYTQCGLRKLICVSRIDDFVLPHLPNRYVGTYGIGALDFSRQLHALAAVCEQRLPATSLADVETNVWLLRWSKSYYEPARPDILALIPEHSRKILSYGCGWGALEEKLVTTGADVTVVPLDSVIASCAEAKGVKVVYGDAVCAVRQLERQRFDCVIVTDLLHLVQAPRNLIASLASLVRPGGVLIASVPNLSQVSVRWRRLMGRPGYGSLGSYDRSRLHLTSRRLLRKWFLGTGMVIDKIIPVFPERAKALARVVGGFGHSLLAEEFLVLSTKQSDPVSV